MKSAGTASMERAGALAADATEGHPAAVGQEMTTASARVAKALLKGGAVTASGLAKRLYLTPTAVRRHLDALVSRGFVTVSTEAPFGPHRARGRGRPAKYYTLTPLGRDAFDARYADVAVEALRFLAARGGREAVKDFAVERTAGLEQRYQGAVAEASTIQGRAEALAAALTTEGFAATTEAGAPGTQLCQHHCPITHVAEEFPQFCEAEQDAFSRLLGVHVTRLATIAAGGGVCTTLIPAPSPTGTTSDFSERTSA